MGFILKSLSGSCLCRCVRFDATRSRSVEEEEATREATRLEQTQQSQPHASSWAPLLLLSAVDHFVTIFIFYFSDHLATK